LDDFIHIESDLIGYKEECHMLRSFELHQQLQDSIDEEIEARIKTHQAKIAQLKAIRKNLGFRDQGPPFIFLAHGDSWFDYPLYGNVPGAYTDIITQLQSMGFSILNISHWGHATTDEMSLPQQERMIEVLSNPANWLHDGKPDGILFSGGGNDIAGDQFCIFLDYKVPGATGLNEDRFQKVLGMVEASYKDLFASATTMLRASQSSDIAMTFRFRMEFLLHVPGRGCNHLFTFVVGSIWRTIQILFSIVS
jgi:hypothetical protein